MVREETGEHRRLLTPSAALGSFNPARGVIAGLKPIPRRRIRYGFRLGNLGFIIKADTVSELVERATVYPVPQTPPWLVGLVNLRGNLVPVFDLNLCLGLESGAREKHYLLVLDESDDAVGLFTENLPQPVGESRKLVRPPPLPKALQGHVAEAYGLNNDIWVEFDHKQFFESLKTQTTTIT